MLLGMPILYEYSSLKENVMLAKNLGLDFIELNLNFEYCRTEIEEGNLLKLLKENNLKATLHFYDEADFASYYEVQYAYYLLLEKYLKLGKDYLDKVNVHLNVGPIVTIGGVKNYIYEKEYETYILRLQRNLSKIRNLCSKYNVELVLENVETPPFIMKSYNELMKNDFCFTYDVGHDDNYFYNIKEISDKLKIREMHLHDGNTKTCHLAIGSGNINIKEYLDLAKKSDAYLLVEVKSSEDLITSIPKIKEMI